MLNEEARMQAAADNQLHQNLQDQLGFEQASVSDDGKEVITDKNVLSDKEAPGILTHIKWMSLDRCNIL